MAPLPIHCYRSEAANTPVNAYLVEGADGVVAVDATLTVSGGRGLRAHAEALGKPLLGVVLTHAHPDHYGGLVALLDGRALPVFATASVSEVIRRDDPVKEQILRPMFGAEWAPQRAFPNEVVADGETVELGDIALTVPTSGRLSRPPTRSGRSTPAPRLLRRPRLRPHALLPRRRVRAGVARQPQPAARRASAGSTCTLVTASQAGSSCSTGRRRTSRRCSARFDYSRRRRRGDDAFLPAVRDARVPDGAQRRAARGVRLTQIAGLVTPNMRPRSHLCPRRRRGAQTLRTDATRSAIAIRMRGDLQRGRRY